MPIATNRSRQKQHEEFARRRKELEARAFQTTDLSELIEIALQYGKMCDEEDALLHITPFHSVFGENLPFMLTENSDSEWSCRLWSLSTRFRSTGDSVVFRPSPGLEEEPPRSQERGFP